MRIRINRDICAGHAVCAAIAPELYTLDDDGYANADKAIVAPGMEALAERGAANCPERAITLERD
jgi:ferredoxin